MADLKTGVNLVTTTGQFSHHYGTRVATQVLAL